jgi:hypothetical protein
MSWTVSIVGIVVVYCALQVWWTWKHNRNLERKP